MRLFALLAAAAAALAACATAAPEPPAPVHYVMRHLHTPAGERDPDLTAEGQRQAALLAGWFGREPPAAIYVSTFKRTLQTAAPLAARLGLTPLVYDPADTPALLARVRAGPRPALIVGHSNTVPDIVEQLGGERPGPLAHEDFGDVWQVGPDGATTRRRIEE
ncbi:MAG TPA: phosphoglycerate mutase family protein [Allosphingosinicella sp.]|nr:phosphoglycerate mutase family protein [Allosphingosinicella sp.]